MVETQPIVLEHGAIGETPIKAEIQTADETSRKERRMSDLISRQAAIEEIVRWIGYIEEQEGDR